MSENELTVKQRHALKFAHQMLLELCCEEGRPVTAGEFAAHLGIARSTAVARLMELANENALVAIRQQARNRFPKIVYEPAGRGETWDYGYGERPDIHTEDE